MSVPGPGRELPGFFQTVLDINVKKKYKYGKTPRRRGSMRAEVSR
jgi:hypothetical protein